MNTIKFSSETFSKRKNTDLLIVPFWEGKKTATPANDIASVQPLLSTPITTGDFKGKKGDSVLVYPEWKKEKRILLIGLGKKDKINAEEIRKAYGKAVALCKCKKLTSLNILLPKTHLPEEKCIHYICEGMLIANYTFDKHKKHTAKEKTPPVKNTTFIAASKKSMLAVNKTAKITEGVYLTRDLVNDNAHESTPQVLASLARKLGKEPGIKTTVFDKKRIQKEGMGLLLAVSQGACYDPTFITMQYKGDPKSKENTVVVGKGITFDSGGLNLKPSGYIETMRSDMAGAAVVFGLIKAISCAKLKINITGVIPATENSISSKSYKPGDVYTSYSGKTVEIGNTDAEGRLILADALSYACKKLKPTRIIDLATLTGAIVVALGYDISGMMTPDDKMAEALSKAAKETYENVWRMPLYQEYKGSLKSKIADISNISTEAGGRSAGSITAALFLQEFVDEKIPWAHLDIAGTAFLPKPTRYYCQGASGVGVRLLIEFLQ